MFQTGFHSESYTVTHGTITGGTIAPDAVVSGTQAQDP